MTPIPKNHPRPASSQRKRKFLGSLDGLLAAISLTLTAPSAFAAALTWDTGSGDGAAITAASGSWNTTVGNLVWNNAGANPNVIWSQTSATVATNAATFAGADGTLDQYVITLSGTTNAQSVTFNNSGYKLTGGTLTLVPTATTSGSITVAAGKTATINSAIAYANNAAAAITVNAGSTLNLGGGATNSQYTFSGAGTVNVTAGTSYSANTGAINVATFNQSGGTFNITPGNGTGYNINSSTQNVAYNLSAGTLSVNGNAITPTVNNAHLGIGNGTGAFTSALNVSGTGIVNVGTTASRSGEIRIGNTFASNGTLNVTGGTVTVGTGSAANQIYFHKAGSNSGFTAAMTQSAGTVTTNGIQFGGSTGLTTYSATSAANLTLSGGSLYIGAAGITRGTDASALPVAIKLQGGTLGADQDWSSSLDMKLGTTAGGPTFLAATSSAVSKNITLSGVLSDDSSVNGKFTKTGAGNLTLSGANTYTGATTISAGTLILGASNVLPNASAVSIAAATLDAATFADTAGTLDVTASTSTINLDTGSTLAFADSSAIDWTGGTLTLTGTFTSGSSLRFGTTSGGLTATQLGKITTSGSPTFTLNANGYLVDNTSPPASDAVLSFGNSGTGFGPTPPYILSGSNTVPITLTFTINGTGVISLNASTTSSSTTFINTVNEWDSSDVGTVTNSACFNTSFTLTGSGSGGANLAITENGGGGIGIQGENTNRVDGLNYGTGGATSTPETLTWTLSGAPTGMALSLKNWSYVEGSGSDIRVSNGTTNADFPNMSGATGTLSLPADFVLNNGGSLTFKEIPGIGLTDGAGIAGFTFAVVTSSAPPGPEGFDNGAGNNLWTNATNWSPDGVPAAPADAIINGHDVILSSAAATSPDELLITNGSLTVTGSGALTMRAMTLGRDLTKTVRLVIHGSGVSFGYSGTSAADEFAVGSAATVETKPDSGGSEPFELGAAKLVLDVGSEWILDGTHFTGPYNIGDRFVLANFGSLTGSTAAMRTRNFDLPSTRRLELVATATSIYYEVKAQTAASGPNIIIINTDDQAADQHYGFDGRNCITPTLDSLVSTGLKFNLAFCAASVCGASRYSLLTSRWPSRNTSGTFIARYPLGTLGRFGVSDTELEHDGQNIGAWLQQAGYRTGFVGKSHVLDDELNFTANWASKGLITYGQTDDPATNATVNAAMQHNHRVVCQNMRTLGYDYVDGFYHANLKELYNNKLNVHNQEWITSRALKFIEENRNEPFFLYMAPTINHGPVNDNLTTDLNADPRYTSAGYLPNEDYSFMPTRASIINQVNAANKPLITARETWIDYSVKAILDKLTAYGIRNNTLIIFTSDHGEKTLSSPTIWGKTSLFDLGMKVPLVMNWPNGIASPGRAYNELVSHVDIGSTLLALAGASNLPTRPVDGVSLVPVLNGSSAAVRSDVFGEMGYARGVRTKTRKYIAVRYTPSIYTQIASGYRWPEYNANTTTGGTVPRPYYINNSGLGGGVAMTNSTYFDDDQLYNLTTDPGENTNIYGQEPATTYDLKKRLASYIGGIPNRPFRQFSDSSKEFSPSPAAAPQPPQSLQGQFQGVNQVKLDWTDAANSELGYIIQKSVNGGPFQIIDEKPSGVTTSTVSVNAGVEDIVLQVSAYNSLGDAGAVNPVDLLTPNSWRFRTFGTADPTLIAPASQWSADADGDGQTNLWEYAFATNPLASSSVARSEGRITVQGQNSYLEYLVPRDARRNIQIVGAVSEDLITWLKGAPACVVAEDDPNHLLFRSASPVKDHPKQFIRAEIAEP